MRTHHCLIIIILIAPLSAFFAVADPWSGSATLIFRVDLDVDNPKVIMIAKFAVDEQNKRSNTNLNLMRVVSCTEDFHLIGGLFLLELLADNGIQIDKYTAMVIERPNFRFTLRPLEYELTSFELAPYPLQ
ncbi:uncharacterized protein LOC130974525 [Arachis stenosperma]|uniref:uncharacterized protein LOC130974525 n=1 Tax=Arachis stenosperma TaxID=217475 RepID=UPI0025AC4A44|nr:uncharacterized protein LOC130974525 [Arachis stenosperma]